jgi:small multidrug resistance pump
VAFSVFRAHRVEKEPGFMNWIYLALAILLEVSGTTSMKLSEGFAKLLPSALIFVFYGMSFIFLTLTIKHMEIGIAYAIWSGIGTALVAAIGVCWFEESFNAMKLISTGLIILGVAGLHLSRLSH